MLAPPVSVVGTTNIVYLVSTPNPAFITWWVEQSSLAFRIRGKLHFCSYRHGGMVTLQFGSNSYDVMTSLLGAQTMPMIRVTVCDRMRFRKQSFPDSLWESSQKSGPIFGPRTKFELHEYHSVACSLMSPTAHAWLCPAVWLDSEVSVRFKFSKKNPLSWAYHHICDRQCTP